MRNTSLGSAMLPALELNPFQVIAFVYAVAVLIVAARTFRVRGKQCRRCGYALIGLRSARCPECGTEIRPTHGVDSIRLTRAERVTLRIVIGVCVLAVFVTSVRALDRGQPWVQRWLPVYAVTTYEAVLTNQQSMKYHGRVLPRGLVDRIEIRARATGWQWGNGGGVSAVEPDEMWITARNGREVAYLKRSAVDQPWWEETLGTRKIVDAEDVLERLNRVFRPADPVERATRDELISKYLNSKYIPGNGRNTIGGPDILTSVAWRSAETNWYYDARPQPFRVKDLSTRAVVIACRVFMGAIGVAILYWIVLGIARSCRVE